jgi:uncharacterized protein (TIGR01777 family)
VRILVTGATGLVGSALVAALAGGSEVIRLSRRAPRAPGDLQWDPDAGTLARAPLEGLDAVVHLAGESIGGRRWNAAHQRSVRESRVRGTRLLSETLGSLARPPRVLVSASGVGWYGDRGEERLTETSGPGNGFLAEVARAWEEATTPAARRGIRVIHLRSGLVLAPRGGALEPMRRLTGLGLGGPLGGGRQWMSWIAIDDLVSAIAHGLTREELRGPVNMVAPGATRQAEFARTLGRVLSRPAWLPAPRLALRLVLGREMADELLLASQRAEPARLRETGFAFRFPALEPALRHVLGRSQTAPHA